MTSLGSRTVSLRSNNLNAIRLFLALMVIFSHSFPLALGRAGGDHEEPLITWTHQQESFGNVAVGLFFLISGLLITASWLHSQSMQDYLMKRVLRIYPGFIVAMGFSALLIWGFCPKFRSAVEHPVQWLFSLLKDLLLLTSSAICDQSIFAGNPFPNFANGSLWTIPLEFFCYLIVLVIGLLCLFKRRFLILMASLLGYEFYVILLSHGNSLIDQYLICFLTGVNFWLWRDKIPLSIPLACGCLVVLLVTCQFRPWFSVVFPIMGGYCLLWLAYGPRLIFLSWADQMDLSYGTYLYAFPIQQMLAMSPALRHPWMNFALAAPITLLAAWLSWNLVEKRFLAMKSLARKDFDPGVGVEL